MRQLYAPAPAEIVSVGERAKLMNTHLDAKDSLLAKLRQPLNDWDCRVPTTVPGLVWTVVSDTCMTGRECAPNNVAFDQYGGEFVFRQPRSEAELAAVMSADSVEVFSCYRFDGLERWTRESVDAWFASHHDLVVGWLDNCLATQPRGAIADSMRDCHAYLTSEDFRTYIADLGEYLSPDCPRPLLTRLRHRQ